MWRTVPRRGPLRSAGALKPGEVANLRVPVSRTCPGVGSDEFGVIVVVMTPARSQGTDGVVLELHLLDLFFRDLTVEGKGDVSQSLLLLGTCWFAHYYPRFYI